MVDAAFLAAMKDGGLLINAARGVLVVTDDLVAEVSSGRLSAAMDVTDPEPLPPGHPLWSLPNVLITPHIGASTPYSGHDGDALRPGAGGALPGRSAACERDHRRLLILQVQPIRRSAR